MKTRTLLLLAVGCGLVILIAGSVKLLLVADADPAKHLTMGTSATIGDMTVSVESFRNSGELGLATVTLVGVDDPDGATTWVFGTGAAPLKPLTDATEAAPACAATERTQLTRCVVAFDTAATQGVLLYQRAGETLRWDVFEQAG